MATRTVVLVSGEGNNLQALIDTQKTSNIQINAVISNCANSYALKRAQKARIKTITLVHTDYPSREAFDQNLKNLIDQHQPELILLAGFMRILTTEFTKHYEGRMLNIHPSLLPRHPGLNTHEKVLKNGDKEHGCSIHFVTAELDGGPVIAKTSIAVDPEDTPESLKQRVLELECKLYPQVASWFASGRLSLTSQQVLLDGNPIVHTSEKEII